MTVGTLAALSVLALAAPATLPQSAEGAEDRTKAPHFVIESAGRDGEQTDALERLPLEATHAEIDVAGVVAHVRVRQVWRNRGTTPIEATYIFPGSSRSAVFGMRMRVGDRVLKAEIKEKDAAKKIYDAAKEQGKTASLLEQHRPNVFQMHVANILPGDRIEVELDYTELLVPDEKVYEIVYPQAVGPRYSKGPTTDDASRGAASGAGERWLANPHRQQAGAPWRWGIDVKLSTGVTLRDIASPSHAIEPTFAAADAATLHVGGAAGEPGGTKDFVLRYRLVGDDIETGVLLFRDDKGPDAENFFLVLAQPPERVSDEQMPPREIVFVVDVSGSMRGFPLGTSKALMRELVGELREEDTFNVLFFAGASFLLSDESLRATPENLERALTAVDDQRGGGGTNLDTALERAFELPTDTRTTSRSFVLLTDGYVSFEPKIFDLVRARAGQANVYAFGVGRSVNRHLIESVAKAGMGQPFVVLDDRSAKQQVQRFSRTLSRPALTNVRVFFEGFDAYDVEPSAPVDLLEDRPLVLFGKFRGPSSGKVRITGVAGDRSFQQTIAVEDHLEKKSHKALRYLWARARVERLADLGTPTPSDIEKVTALGLRYSLLTKWTSFVAVDYLVRNASGKNANVDQPLPLPEGVSMGGTPSAGEGAQQRFGGKHGGKTIINFSFDKIDGELSKPDGALMVRKKKSSRDSSLPIRKDFADRMRSVDTMSSLGVIGGSSGAAAVQSATGTGGLGLRGTGSGGGGSGYGSGNGRGGIDLGGRGKGTSRIRPGKVTVKGSLSREEIQRVLRRQMNSVRYCYEKELQRDPKLSGRLVVSFVIDAKGLVKTALITKDELGSTAVSECVQRIVARLRFPHVRGGGEVKVNYPFVFKSAD